MSYDNLRRVLLVVFLTAGVTGRSIDRTASWPTLTSRLRPKTSNDVQAATVIAMIGRILPPQYIDQFEVVVNESLDDGQGPANRHDVFILETVTDNVGGSRLKIGGRTGVAAAAGFQYYLKKYCGGHLSWSGNQVRLPDELPRLNVSERVMANDYVRYYQNVCTASYSFVWWDWSRWEREIDWMALNWINLPLAPVGQEEIFRRVFVKLNFTQTDLDTFFAGPAFLAWNRMGNIDGWAGPLPDSWYAGQLRLQHSILDRMRDFGMVPALPAFAGHVPATIRTRFPDVNVTRLGSWNKFDDTYSATYLLDHREQLFQTIGKNVIDEMKNEFGVDHFYYADTFNEMSPPTVDVDYIAGVGQAVFAAMTSADPMAIWIMQGWLFLDPYWTPTLAKALLTSVPLGSMLVLDLHADIVPIYSKFDSFYGQPFVWCMLHNFGAANGLYGAVDNVNRGPFDARAFNRSTMVGTGLTPEGIEQNDVVYELMNEMSWRKEPVDALLWVADYATRRYGVRNDDAIDAWQRLVRSAYNCNNLSFKGNFVVTNRPTLRADPSLCYDLMDVVLALESFIKAAVHINISNNDLFLHDYVDVVRETNVAVNGGLLYVNLVVGYVAKNSLLIQRTGESLSALMVGLDKVLEVDRRFRLSDWLKSARACAADEREADLYEYNARNQITLWGPQGEIVDYANKQWAGLFSDYYAPRWALFVDQLLVSVQTSTPFNQSQYNIDVFTQVEQPFTESKINDTADVSSALTRELELQVLQDFGVQWTAIIKEDLFTRSKPSVSDLAIEPLLSSNFPQVHLNNQGWVSGRRR